MLERTDENNCICHESKSHIHNDTWIELTYHGDVDQLVANNFRGVKLDSCGLRKDPDTSQFVRNPCHPASLTLFLVTHWHCFLDICKRTLPAVVDGARRALTRFPCMAHRSLA